LYPQFETLTKVTSVGQVRASNYRAPQAVSAGCSPAHQVNPTAWRALPVRTSIMDDLIPGGCESQ